MAESFSLGDVVRLKSGGPDMTVTNIATMSGKPMVWCKWFNKESVVYTTSEDSFPPEAIVRSK